MGKSTVAKWKKAERQISHSDPTKHILLADETIRKSFLKKKKNQTKFELNHFKNKKATLRHLTIIIITNYPLSIII